MKFVCMSCDTHYDFPDAKVVAAEPEGLRVRCSSCRAIMVVSLSRRLDSTEDDTAPELKVRRRKPRPSSVLPELTGIHASERYDIPGHAQASGQVVAEPGISRALTGVHLRESNETLEKAVWFAALGGRPRGPYTTKEMERLAGEGRVRGSTLVWRPGFTEWSRVRSGRNEHADLTWLRQLVVARKRNENGAENLAREKHGITKLMLESNDVQPRSSLPPPAPLDDDQESTDSEFVSDAIFGAPTLGTIGDARPSKRGFFLPVVSVVFAGLVVGSVAAVVAFYVLPMLGVYSLPSFLK